MKIKTVPNFIDEVNTERFIKNRDKLMKYIEEDYKFLAWICWGLNILFKQYSYKEMFDYIGKVSDKELSKYIVPVEIHISTEDIEGVIFDKHFELHEFEEITGYLIIENQLDLYPFKEIDARGLAYVIASLFWTYNQVIDKKHYHLVNPPTVLWIFPEPAKKWSNHITDEPIIFPTEDKIYEIKAGSSLSPEVQKPRFQINTNIFKYYLGNCLEAKEGPLSDKSKAGKRAYLILLLDAVFNFDVSKEIRLKIVEKYFNFNGDNLMNETEKVMKQLQGIMNRGIEQGIELGKEEQYKTNVNNLAQKLISESKDQGINLTKEAAIKKAEELIS